MDDAAHEEVPGPAARAGAAGKGAAAALVALGAALVGLRAGWTAGAEAFVGRLWGLELWSWSPAEARAVGRALAPGVSAPEGTGTWAGILGWVVLVAALAVGALVIAPAIARLVPRRDAAGVERATAGPGLRLAAALGSALAGSPWMPDFVARRTALGADAYLDLGDLAFGLGVGALLAGALLWRRGAPAAALPAEQGGVRLPLAAAALLAALGPSVLSSVYLDHEPVTNDGVAYRWQAELFAEGRLEAPSTVLDQAFGARQLLPPPGVLGVGPMQDGRFPTWSGWTAKYPPGHAALLAPGTALGAPRLLPLALAGLCVLLTFHLAWRLGAGLAAATRRRLALGAAWVLAASPMVLGVESLWLSHGTSLPAGLLFAVAWLSAWAKASGDEPGSPWPAALVAGVAISLCLAARPLTALALALPLAAWTLRDLALCPAPRAPGAGDAGRDPSHPTEALSGRSPLGPVLRRPLVMGAALLAALPGLVAFGLVNLEITDVVTRPVYDLYAELLSPNDRWGLVNLGTALEYTLYNLARLSPWLLGGPPALLLLVLGWRRLGAHRARDLEGCPRPRPGARPLELTWLVPLAFLALYALHRFQGIPWVGPLYLVEALPFLALPAAAGVLAVARRLGVASVVAPFAVCGALGLALLHPHLDLAGERVSDRLAPARAAEEVRQRLAEQGLDQRLLVLIQVDTPDREKRTPLPPPSILVDPVTGELAPLRWPVFGRVGAIDDPWIEELHQLLGEPVTMYWSADEGQGYRLH